MKKIISLFLCAATLISSCKKNSPSGGPAIDATKYYVSSVKNFIPGYQGIDSFTYNGSNLLTSYKQYSFDSTSGSPLSDSLVFEFSYTGSSQVPSSYTFSQPSQGTIGELHQLSYDGQNRVTSDVCPSRSDFFTNYTYPNNNLAGMLQFSSNGLDNQIDTLYMTNGNITRQVVYFPNNAGTADSLEGTTLETFSTYGNPLYHPQISGSIGHLLFILSFDGFQNFIDFNSKNLDNSVTDVEPGFPNRTFNYTLITDSKGRVAQANYIGYPASAYRIVYSYY